MCDHREPLPAPVVDAPPSGYQRRFIATEPRLSEAVQTYRDLGLDVVLVPSKNIDLNDQECRECLDDTYGIYTRQRGSADIP
jgi:hypothetical protein